MPVGVIAMILGYGFSTLLVGGLAGAVVSEWSHGKKEEARLALAKKKICLSPAAKRPKKQIPTYLWIFSKMSDKQTKLVCFWIQELLKTIKSTKPVSTYTKDIFTDDTVESVTLPAETVKASWEKNWLGEKKVVEWWITPHDKDGFIVEGDVSWINENVLAELPETTTQPKYVWMFRDMSSRQTKIICSLIESQMNLFRHLAKDTDTKPSVSTYTKNISNGDTEMSITLPAEVYRFKWKKSESLIIPQGEDGFIVRGNVSWIPKDMLALLPCAIGHYMVNV